MNRCQFFNKMVMEHSEHQVFSFTYQQVEYLQSTGTQAIDTGLYATPYTAVSMDMQCTSVTAQTRLFSTESSGVRFAAYISGSTKWSYIFNASQSYINTSVTANTSRHVITLDGCNQNYKVDGTVQSTFTRPTASTPGTIILLALSTAGSNGFSGKLYSCRISDNNALIRDFVPCYRKSDNKPGMYDLVSNTFFTNQGSGEFTVGPDV